MSTFVSRTNPVTGKLDWIVQNEDYDFHQEVARYAKKLNYDLFG
jgi:protein arginine N-methyltransferase 7